MINNFRTFIKHVPNWRILIAVVLSAFLTLMTSHVFSGYLNDLVRNSTTLLNLQYALKDILGFGKYQMMLNFIDHFSKVFLLLIFLFYMYLFYRWEKKRQYMDDLHRLITKTLYMAEGNFDDQIEPQQYKDLDLLATNLNTIVVRLKEAIEEERHLEKTKSELITNVSHDLRTPLTSIVGYLRVIENDEYRDEVTLRHYTGIAYDKALHLERLINELFEYTRMQDRGISLQKTPLHIAELLGQIVIQNEIHFIENNVECIEQISEVEALVLGDGERLARVFENLITNAIHYGKDGKHICIRAEEDELHVIVSITNYGKPIASHDLPYIFERFYRAEKSRSINTGGSGLGLAIAKSIVSHHGGTIEVTSDEEKTSFIVKLNKIQ